jgi:hypothetical protein
VTHEIQRGEGEELEGLLTSGGNGRELPDFWGRTTGGGARLRPDSLVNASGAVWSGGGGGLRAARGQGGAQGDDLGQGRAAPGSASPFYGDARSRPRRRRCPGRRGLWPRAGWAPPGQAAGPERVGPSGSARSSRVDFLFFSNLFLMRKQIPEKSRNCLEARKILRKSQKFQENS